MITAEQASVNRQRLDITHQTTHEEQKLLLVVNNTRQREKDQDEDGCRLIYDRPIFRAKRHDPF